MLKGPRIILWFSFPVACVGLAAWSIYLDHLETLEVMRLATAGSRLSDVQMTGAGHGIMAFLGLAAGLVAAWRAYAVFPRTEEPEANS